MRRRPLTVLAALLVLGAGCVELLPYESTGSGPAPRFPDPPPESFADAQPGDTGHLVLRWPSSVSPRFEAYEAALHLEGAFETWVARMDDLLVLPEDITIAHTECGIENAYYAADEATVYLCWELLDRIAYVMSDPSLSAEETQLGIGSVWLFVAFHEMGHALIDLLELPITGREEDAVDDLATLLLIDAEADDAAVSAAVFWILTDDGSYSQAKFADEHSLHSQRFYAILCTVYGSDPTSWAAIVEEGYLPYERAQRCPREYAQKDASWERLLEPWTVD